jgi:hypothetical protein
MAETAPPWKVPPWAWLAAGGLVGTGGGWTITRTDKEQPEPTEAECAALEEAAAECAAAVDVLLAQLAECYPSE